MTDVSERTLRRWAEALAGDRAGPGSASPRASTSASASRRSSAIAADIRAAADEGAERRLDADGLVAEWLGEVDKGVAGYVTPKVAVGAAVSNDDGELLLIQRADSGVWLYPTGWCDVGYSAAEVVTKEVAEETGIEVEPVRLIGVLDGLRLGMSRIPLYSLLFLCRAVGGELRAAPARVHRRRLVHRVDAARARSSATSGGASRSSPRCAARCATSTTTRCAGRCGGGSRDRPRRARRRRRRRAGRRGPAPLAPALRERAAPRGERRRDRRDLGRDDAARRPRRRRARSSGC